MCRAAIPAFASLLALVLLCTPLDAQAPSGVVSGVVTVIGSGRPLVGASISLDQSALVATSDSVGRFRITGVAGGAHVITARRIGFGSVTAQISVGGSGETVVDVELEPSGAVQLEEVRVTADSQPHGKLAGMEHRRSINAGGTFITGAELDSAAGRSLPYVLARRLTGAQLTLNGRTGAMLLSSGRGRTSGLQLPPADPADPRSPRGCWAQVYLDGIRIYSIKQGGMAAPDLREFRVETLAGIEYYAGEAQTPSEFAGEGATCGTIALWTK